MLAFEHLTYLAEFVQASLDMMHSFHAAQVGIAKRMEDLGEK